MMDLRRNDLFANALAEAEKVTVWNKLTVEQQSRLVSRYIMQFFTSLNQVETAEAASAAAIFSEPV